jgi:hypothetical protein
MKVRGVGGNIDIAELEITQDGPLVSLAAGGGYEVGTVHLTPAQARHAASEILRYADDAERDVQVTELRLQLEGDSDSPTSRKTGMPVIPVTRRE